MFTHVMIGSNDLERSRAFYDATFAALGGKPGETDPRGRLIYAHEGGGAADDHETHRRQAGNCCQRRDDRYRRSEPRPCSSVA